MKSSLRWAVVVMLLTGVSVIHADLAPWLENTVAGSVLEAALYRAMDVPGGPVLHVRPPVESRSHLSRLIQQSPQDVDLYSVRAREEERALNYSAAEADWKYAVAHRTDKLSAQMELADFYGRRLDPQREADALLAAGSLPATQGEQRQANQHQPQWSAFRRASVVADVSLLPAAIHRDVHEAWIRRYPKDPEAYRLYLVWLLKQRNLAAATALAVRIKSVFPSDVELTVTTEVTIARITGGEPSALEVYDNKFSPFWPAELKAQYFHALSNAHQLRAFLDKYQAAAARNPTDLDPVLRVDFYYEQQNRKDLADEELIRFLSRKTAAKSPWTANELRILAPLLAGVRDYDESARSYYRLYELPASSAGDRELALASLISLLLDVPEQPIHFGNRDLSLYQNIAQMDRHPGFLNGILSLALNTTDPAYQYQNASQNAVSYFHRASASRLIQKLKHDFPNSRQAPELEAKLFSAYQLYGEYDAIIRLVPAWLKTNQNSPEYVATALLLADAYFRRADTTREVALYSLLLTELANKGDHVPLGPIALNHGRRTPPRSPDYAQVLDRYISRLVQLHRPMDAIALFGREIDQNPDDPGLYERLALFVEENRLDNELEQTYRQAFGHFKDSSWASKLARFYLRQKQYSAYETLLRQVTDTFKGSQLAPFLTQVAPAPGVNPQLHLQILLYAHQRFPHNLTIVRSLLQAYRSKGTEDVTAYERLLRENWYYDRNLRTSFYAYLSEKGMLQSELAALPAVTRAGADGNLAALQFRAEGQTWLADYESAAPAFVRLAEIAPGNREANERAISIQRSLAPSVVGAFDSAIRLAEQDVKAAPTERPAAIRVGEIYADRELYAQARPWWNRAAILQPGVPKGYLDSATVFWDYFQFDDALRIISDARRRLGEPALFGYEAGAIYENEGRYQQAINAYIQAALQGYSDEARERLLTLAQRKPTASLVERQTASLTATGFDTAGFELRLALLEKQKRESEIEGLLATMLPRASEPDQIYSIQAAAYRLGFDDIAARAIERTIAITKDPVEKLRARIDLARFYGSHRKTSEAEREFASLLNDHPNLLGVIRSAVDFYWRENQPDRAIQTLAAAADRAQQPYQTQLRQEAAQKATDAGEYDQARGFLRQLLQTDPYDANLLAAEALTYARQRDATGLTSFYATQLKDMQAAALPAQDKTERIAALRRGYIPALVATGDYAQALQQYEQVLNQYPEDASLAAEVSRFAEGHELDAKLTAYYEKAMQDSPRDYRWPLVLARIETSLRQYPAAIAAYEKATHVRPDRTDLFIAKADLETRLQHFGDAIKTYQTIYQLSYHDTQYLSAETTLYARLGNKAQAVQMLRAAYIEPHHNEPAGYVLAMQTLAGWKMFEEVDQIFAEVRPQLASNRIWTNQALTVEAEALTSLHRPMDAVALVAAIIQRPEDTRALAGTIGDAARKYLTPEEKDKLVQQIQGSPGLPPQFDTYVFAQAAGLRDLEATALDHKAESSGNFLWRNLDELQSSRLRFEQLGQQLEAIAKIHPIAEQRQQIEAAAFRAYRNAGDTASQLRLAQFAGPTFPALFIEAGGDLQARPAPLAVQDANRANLVVQYLIANGTPQDAARSIAIRGHLLSPLWTNSYTALAGLYLLSAGEWVHAAFESVLGPRTVSGELAAHDPDTLRSTEWFYYAARYGDYQGYQKQPDAVEFLPASLEASPAASNSYVELGDTYEDLQQPTLAATQYRAALQLSPDRSEVYDRLAVLAMHAKERTQAIDDWRRAFQLLAARIEQGPLPPNYWQNAKNALTHMNQYQLANELEPDATAMLQAYIKRNGAYNFMPFLEGIFDHAPDQKAALEWVIKLSSTPNMGGLLREVLNSQWIPEPAKDVVYRTQIERDRDAVSSSSGAAAEQAKQDLKNALIEYALYLGRQGRAADEWSILQQIQPASERPADALLKTAALTGRLQELLTMYQTEPDKAPVADQMLSVAASLQKAGRQDLALKIEEFEYQRELQSSNPAASAWFGLARVRFEQKRQADGLTLIRDVTLTAGAPFENLPEAVRMLESYGLKADAAGYAEQWKTAEPWNSDAEFAFARLKSDVVQLNALRRSGGVSYTIRCSAATAMGDLGSSVPGSDELSLLTHKSISPEESAKPFYVSARLVAASSATLTDQVKLYGQVIAIDPGLRQAKLEFAEATLKTNQTAIGLAAFDNYRTTQYQTESSQTSNVPGTILLSVEELAASALVHGQEFGRAIDIYDELLRQIKDPTTRSQFQKLKAEAVNKQSLETLNSMRQPIVTNEISQRTVVKPKLTALPPDSQYGRTNGEAR